MVHTTRTLLSFAAAVSGVVLAAVTGFGSTAGASQGARIAGALDASAIESTPQSDQARVTGSARIHYQYSPDDDIRFEFDARATPFTEPEPQPGNAVGTVRFRHSVAATGDVQWAEAEVDCLLTAGSSATLTATVTKASEGVEDWIDRRLGFSVHDGGPDRGRSRDRMGFSWGVVHAPATDMCMAPVPFATVVHGGFTVDNPGLPPLPTAGAAGPLS